MTLFVDPAGRPRFFGGMVGVAATLGLAVTGKSERSSSRSESTMRISAERGLTLAGAIERCAGRFGRMLWDENDAFTGLEGLRWNKTHNFLTRS